MTVSAMPLASDHNPPRADHLDNKSDEQLAIRLTARPTLLSETQGRATSLYNQARKLPGIKLAVDAIWTDYQAQSIRAGRDAASNQPQVAACRIALNAIAFFGDLLNLGISHPGHALEIPNFFAGAGHLADTPEARKMLQSRPATAAWLQRRDQEKARIEAAQQAYLDRQAQAAPGNFLVEIRRRGLDIQIDEAGNLVLPAGMDASRLSVNDLQTIKQWKPQLTEVLQAEAADRAAMAAALAARKPPSPTVLA